MLFTDDADNITVGAAVGAAVGLVVVAACSVVLVVWLVRLVKSQTRFANKNTHCGIHGHTHTHLYAHTVLVCVCSHRRCSLQQCRYAIL